MDWIMTLQIMGVIGGVATIFALFLAPYFWLASKIDSIVTEMHSFKECMHQDMKDFHGRLCAIEERNKAGK